MGLAAFRLFLDYLPASGLHTALEASEATCAHAPQKDLSAQRLL